MICCRILFRFSALGLLSKNLHCLSFGLDIYSAPGVLRFQNLLDSNLDYLVASDWIQNQSCFFLFNILRVSLAVWVLALSCMNKYSLCVANLFIPRIIFFDSTSIILPIYLSICFNKLILTSFQYCLINIAS